MSNIFRLFYKNKLNFFAIFVKIVSIFYEALFFRSLFRGFLPIFIGFLEAILRAFRILCEEILCFSHCIKMLNIGIKMQKRSPSRSVLAARFAIDFFTLSCYNNKVILRLFLWGRALFWEVAFMKL